MKDPFVRAPSEYTRDINILNNYHENMAQYISIMSGKPKDVALEWLKANSQFQEPVLKTLARRDGSPDRRKEKQPLTNYLNEIEHTGRILGPNLIMYSNPDKKLGFLPDFIDQGLQRRSKVKKEGQKAKMEGNMELATFCNNQQSTIKILNNSISGAHSSPHNPIYNASAHTTLTSICRCATSYSNAVAERLLMGNRHYYNSEVTLSEMAASIRLADESLVKEALATYKLTAPSPEYLKDHVFKSCRRYWRSPKGVEQVSAFIDKMEDWQRAVVAFTYDLRAMRDVNEGFMRAFIGQLVEKPMEGVEDPDVYVQGAHPDLVAMIGLVMSEELSGKTVYDMAKDNPEGYKLYGAAIKQTQEALSNYQLYIDAFLKSDHMPHGVHSVPTILRDCAVVSDTDSTIFTTEDWVVWYIGQNDFTRRGMSVAGAMAYIDSQVLKHVLAQLSRHLGVKDDKLFRLAMKSEFYQPVLGVTNMAKHYFSYIRACEGNVYPEPEFDSKGVNLKNSRLPSIITETLGNYIKWIMDSIMANNRPTMYEALRVPVTLAHEVNRSIMAGESTYLASMQIKAAKAYKNASRSNHVHYDLWNKVFACRYGVADPPPYAAVKVPVDLGSPVKLKEWMETLEPEMQEGLREWLAASYSCQCEETSEKDVVCPTCGTKATGRSSFSNFLIPRSRLQKGKVPEEILKVINVEHIESEMMAGFLIILETMGIYLRNKKKTRLLSKEVDVNIYKTA